jgi:S-adenosylmethionine decarboxylase
MQGLHLTADCHHCCCDATLLVDAAVLLQLCLKVVETAGLQAVNQLAHEFPAVGVIKSGVTATWPELQAVTLDVYVCNFGGDHSAKAHRLMDALLAAFKPESTDRHELHRGTLIETKSII